MKTKKMLFLAALMFVSAEAFGWTIDARIKMSGQINCLAANELGDAYVGVGTKVFVRFHDGQQVTKELGYAVKKILAKGDTMLLAKTTGGLILANRQLTTQKELPDLYTAKIMVKKIAVNSQGTIFVLTTDGKIVFLLKGYDYWNPVSVPDSFKPLPEDIGDMAIDSADNAWVMAKNYRYVFNSRDRQTIDVSISSSFSYRFVTASKGIIWTGDAPDSPDNYQVFITWNATSPGSFGGCWFEPTDQYRAYAIVSDGPILYLSVLNRQDKTKGGLMQSSDAHFEPCTLSVITTDFWSTCGDLVFANGKLFVPFKDELVIVGDLTGVEEPEQPQTSQPIEFRLEQNYPNPFNPETTISYSLPQSTTVKLTVYDLNGRIVAVLVNERQGLGKYRLRWNAGNSPAGVYLYRLVTENFTITKKMTLTR